MPSILTIARQRRRRRQQSLSSGHQRVQRTVLGTGFLLSTFLVVLILGGALTYASLTSGLPSLDKLTVLLDPARGELLQPTRLYDRTGEHLLAVLAPVDGPREYIPYADIPPALIQAAVASVQPDFWTSPGYRLSGWRLPETHPTIAQQLAADLLLWDSPASTVRAIHERMLASQMTVTYGREKVMEWYLNTVDYGHYAYGIEAAAQLYLGKSVRQLDLGESALLAAIARAPALNPIDAPQAAEQQRMEIIRSMLEQGLITPAETSQAVLNPPSPLTELPQANGGIGEAAPAFVNLALAELQEQFGGKRISLGGLNILHQPGL